MMDDFTMRYELCFDHDEDIYEYADLIICPVCEIERLRAERDALKADAERYRWLRDPCSGAERVFYCRGDYGKGLPSGGALDAAIDAARGE